MRLKDATVLVADDEPLLLDLLSTWFAREGCRVLSAANGALALEQITLESPNVLVTDVRMPVMDGIELLESIKHRSDYRPSVVFLSGYSLISERMACDLGVEAVLSKPVERRKLVSTVERVLVDRSELWSCEKSATSDQSLDARYRAFSDAVREGHIAFGRGGFCIQSEQEFYEGPVRIGLHFDKENQSLVGGGQVRWCEPNENKFGIEILSLHPDCLDWVYHVTSANPTLSFIPSHPLTTAEPMSAAHASPF